MEKIQDKGLCSQGASSFQAQGAMGECAILGKPQMERVMGGSSSTWGNPGRFHGRGVIWKHKGSKGSAQKEVREGEGLFSTRSAGGLAVQQKERAGQYPLGSGSLLQSHRSPGFSWPPVTSPPSCSPGKRWLARAGGPELTSLTPSRVLCTVKSIHLEPVMI